MMNEVLKIKQGDHFYFEIAYKQFQKGVYFFILKKSKSEYLAEETVQETFVKLWKRRENLNENISLSSQIFQIAKTTFIDLLRKQSNLKKLKLSYSNSIKDIAENTILQNLELQQRDKVFKLAVDKMPVVRKKVFLMRSIKGLSYLEIACELSISSKTVENHISLAIKQIQFVLQSIT
jgi:RNA polymerase sigma-70 factor (ECF subfamily)